MHVSSLLRLLERKHEGWHPARETSPGKVTPRSVTPPLTARLQRPVLQYNVNKAKPQTRGSERGEKLVLPVMFIQHQQYLDRRMLQFWALRPSITDSSLTLSLELSVSSMASVSFWKEHKRNPSESNGDMRT